MTSLENKERLKQTYFYKTPRAKPPKWSVKRETDNTSCLSADGGTC